MTLYNQEASYCGGSTHTMYSLGIVLSWVSSLVGVSIAAGTGSVLEAQPAKEQPSSEWIKAKETGQDRAVIQE